MNRQQRSESKSESEHGSETVGTEIARDKAGCVEELTDSVEEEEGEMNEWIQSNRILIDN